MKELSVEEKMNVEGGKTYSCDGLWGIDLKPCYYSTTNLLHYLAHVAVNHART